MAIVPVLCPAFLGLKIMVRVQLPPAGRLEGQSSVSVKLPLTTNLPTKFTVGPFGTGSLSSVIVCATLDLPTATFPKVNPAPGDILSGLPKFAFNSTGKRPPSSSQGLD